MNHNHSHSSRSIAADFRYAPPDFVNEAGQNVVFVHIHEARYEIHFDATARTASVDTVMSFESRSRGYPVIASRQPASSVELDGEAVDLQDQEAPDGTATFKQLMKSVPPGRHVVKIASVITEDGADGAPIAWLSDPDRLHCLFPMTDIGLDGGFLESYLPSNYEHDHFQMTFAVKITNSPAAYSIFTNGTVTGRATHEWEVDFPAHYTTSCPWFHIGPTDEFRTLESHFDTTDGRRLPILLYTRPSHIGRGLDLDEFRDLTLLSLRDLESDFGPFPHDALTIFAMDLNGRYGGMEYAGATATELGALRHELDHSYFARSITPANGDAGWIDEAIASWGDAGYPRSPSPPGLGANMGKRSAYGRTTSVHAYTRGRDFVAHLDWLLRDRGGMKTFLAEYAARKRRASITAAEFQSMVEAFHGAPLTALFDTYVYSDPPLGRAAAVARSPQEEVNPCHASIRDVLRAALPRVGE